MVFKDHDHIDRELVPRKGIEPMLARSERALLPLEDLGMWCMRRELNPNLKIKNQLLYL
jgi:hypothetical protein